MRLQILMFVSKSLSSLKLGMLLIVLLIVLFLSFHYAADKTTVIQSLASAMVGGLIAVLGQQYFQQEEEMNRRRGATNSLRAEAELNLQIANQGKDEKLRAYSSYAFDHTGEYLLDLKSTVYEQLKVGYSAIHMHRQTLVVELTRTGQGDTLMAYTEAIKRSFDSALREESWLV